MALEVQLILFEPGDVELLTAGASLELADNIFLVVTHNPVLRASALGCSFTGLKGLCANKDICSLGDDVGGGDTLRPLGDQELPSLLAGAVDVVGIRAGVGLVVMGNIVNRVLVQEFRTDNPRSVLNNFVDPFAVSECFSPFLVREDGESLPLVGFRVIWNSNEQVGIRECLLGLLELSHMPGFFPNRTVPSEYIFFLLYTLDV